MGDFSRSPRDELAANRARGYVGVHFEQGVPILDRDLNLLNDLVSATARAVVARYIGNGVAAGGDGFQVQAVPADNDFRVLAGPPGAVGTCLVDGVEVTIAAPITYASQADVPALTTPGPTQPDPREDVVFLDVWLDHVEGDEDTDLLNPTDVGLQTSVRLRPDWRVRVAEGVDPPTPEVGHAHYPLARLRRPRNVPQVAADMITDLRQTRLTVADLEDRVRTLERLSLIPAFDPSPQQFSPPLGAPGTTVTLFGRNFDVGSPAVLFGALPAAAVGLPTPTGVTAVVPAGAAPGPVRITITTDGGTAVSDDFFNVLAGGPVVNPPTLASPPSEFSPILGAPTTAVTIHGNHFDGGGLSVDFGGTIATIDSATAVEIVARVPAMASGPVNITVTTDAGSATSVQNFTVL